jgi:hypothetical protein
VVRRCKHLEWVEVGRTYTAGPKEATIESGSREFYERLTFGITNIELRCEACGDRKFVTTSGKAEKP